MSEVTDVIETVDNTNTMDVADKESMESLKYYLTKEKTLKDEAKNVLEWLGSERTKSGEITISEILVIDKLNSIFPYSSLFVTMKKKYQLTDDTDVLVAERLEHLSKKYPDYLSEELTNGIFSHLNGEEITIKKLETFLIKLGEISGKIIGERLGGEVGLDEFSKEIEQVATYLMSNFILGD
jgi:hypothetical protein